ncbi:MAG: lycopene cyclase domain-containing protein [Sporichthyaceae bacterium]
MSYTALALLAAAAAVVLDLVVLRTRLLSRRTFWTAYAIVVVFQLVTNGWLTGRDIVSYDEDAIVGARLAYAPVEDLLFGFSLVVQTLSWWVWWGARLNHSGATHHDGRDAHAATRAQRPSTGLPPAP